MGCGSLLAFFAGGTSNYVCLQALLALPFPLVNIIAEKREG